MRGIMAKKPKAKMDMPDAPDPMKPRGMPDFMQRAKRPGGMAKGGKVHSDAAMDRKLIREEIDKAHKKMGMRSGGKVKAMPMRAFKGKK